jgi:mono/diheme cytochrome c family protein
MRARWLAVVVGIAVAAGAPARAADPAQAARGQQVFTHRCSMCHREGGTGTFILARRLGADKSLLEKRSDLLPDYVRTVVRWGLVNMPRLSRVEVPDPDLDAVIAYLTSPKATRAP